MTFSIVARADDGESWGVAVASKFLAVGSVVPAAAAGVGAVATQSRANVAYKSAALAHMDEGATAAVALQRLLDEDDLRDQRQVGIVDVEGRAASHTGAECLEWAGGVTGDGYAIQGNILAGEEVVLAMQSAFLASDTAAPLAERLLAALRAGDAAGGDARGRQSAAMLVVRDKAGFDGGDDIEVELRVEDHASPIDEMERLLMVHQQLHVEVPEDERTPDTPDCSPRWTPGRKLWGCGRLQSGSASTTTKVSGVKTGPRLGWLRSYAGPLRTGRPARERPRIRARGALTSGVMTQTSDPVARSCRSAC